jgi:ribosomal protein S27E
MKSRKCPHCGSTRITTSPSGEHLLCLGCQRILVQPREKEGAKEAEQMQEADSPPEPVTEIRN